jgi:hypothetical protein
MLPLTLAHVYQYSKYVTLHDWNERNPMAEKTSILQQPVISIRISDEMRSRLETLKEIMAAKSGEPVSTSEAAKQLLESANEERLEFVDLLSEPTDSLAKIRGKVDAKLPLSHAEWTLVAYYCQQGAELFANTGQTEVSFESLAGILEAFLAVYALVSKQKNRSPMAPYLLTHLPSEKHTEGKHSEEIENDDVRRAVNRTIQKLKNATTDTPRPIHTVRLLYMVLDNEKFLNVGKLNEALRPYWPILWRVCARGHYLRHGKCIRDSAFWGADFSSRNRRPLPSFREGEYRLEFHRGPETEFSVWLHLPGRFALQYPIYDYPRIAELRTILEELDLRDTLIFWEGRYFLASTWLDQEEKVGVEFRSRENGITLTFHHGDWQAIKNLFRRGWQAAEVVRLWNALAREYGEL